MTKVFWRTLAVAIVIAAGAIQGSTRDSLETRARTFTQSFFDGRYDDLRKLFDDRMREALTRDKYDEVRKSVIGQFGAFTGMLGVRFEKHNVYDIVYVTCQFAQERLDTKVVFDTAMQVSGLFFSPPPPAEDYKLPLYVRPTSFTERTALLNKGTPFELEGTLSFPNGDAPCPCVALVHGSGPNDRDETIGVLKPFKDIAAGLASTGIGVLRYDKRTKVHPERAAASPNFTVREEVIDDAIEAVRVLREEPKCDKNKVYLLGHSLGAMLMPRIAGQATDVAGFILLSAPNRPLEDMILSQTEYILMLDGLLSEADSATLKGVAAVTGRVHFLTADSPDQPAESLLNAPKSYWLDLKGYIPAEAAKTITKPVLVLQGGRDYQVTMSDFQAWQRMLKVKSNFTFKSYLRMNHVFMEGEGKSSPAEYNRPGNVAKVVIDDIARWIKAQ